MNILLTFCERAESRADGRLDILGVFNELHAPGFPARQEKIVLAGLLEWPRTTAGRQAFRIDVRDPQGADVFTVEGHTDVDARPAHRALAKTHLVLPIERLVFPQSGEYQVVTTIAGVEHAGPVLQLLHVTDTDL